MALVTKTLKDAGFDGVFTEVEHTESLGLRNPHELRMFHLDISSCAFSFRAMHDFLLSNIGRYVFSRAKMEQFRVEDNMEAVGAKAIHLLKQAGNMDEDWIGEELGDILLYVFLEQILCAPKLFSKIELLSYGGTVDRGGIHLLSLGEDDTIPTYQLVFGNSSVVGDLRDAIDSAFASLIAVRDNTARELQLVENTAFTQMYDLETAEKLKDIIIPRPGRKIAEVDRAFGVFLGYSLGLDAEKYSNAEFRAEATRKMQTDVKAHASYIAQKIREANMGMHSFYFYILPFNDADNEKESVMTVLLDGEA